MKKNKTTPKKSKLDLDFLKSLDVEFSLKYRVTDEDYPYQTIKGKLTSLEYNEETKEEKTIEYGTIKAFRMATKNYSFDFFDSISNSMYIIAQFGLEQGGFIDYLNDSETYGLLIVEEMFVHEDFRGKGIGKLMMGHLVENFKGEYDALLTYPCPLEYIEDRTQIKKKFEQLYNFYESMGMSIIPQYNKEGEEIVAKTHKIYILNRDEDLIVGNVAECFQDGPIKVLAKKDLSRINVNDAGFSLETIALLSKVKIQNVGSLAYYSKDRLTVKGFTEKTIADVNRVLKTYDVQLKNTK